MVSILKGFFQKRELTDEELYSSYINSSKSVKDFEKYIMKIKEENLKVKYLIKEICELKLSNFQEINELIEILERNNIDKGFSLSNNIYKKKLKSIHNQLKTICYIHKNFIPENEMLKNFIYSNKFELFNYLRKNYDKNKNSNLLLFIYDNYFNQQNYLNSLEYFLLKDFENDIKFLLPNTNNYSKIKENNAIPIYAKLSDIYYNVEKEEETINEINNLFLNLIIYFYNKYNEAQISQNLNKYIPSKSLEYIENILTLYKLAKKINEKLTLEEFITSKNLVNNFKKISSVDYLVFKDVLNDIMKLEKQLSKIYKGLKYLPLEIIRDMIISRAKNDFITTGIDIIINSNEYNNTAVFNFILKYLFDYYCFNKISLHQLIKIIEYLFKYNSNFKIIKNQLDNLIEVIEIFEKQNMDFIINELINDDINNINKNNKFIIIFLDYLNILAEKTIQYNKYNFIDNNIDDINKLISYKKGLTYGKLLKYFFDNYENKRNLIINILSTNKNIFLNENDIQYLIDLYLLNPYLIKEDSYDLIENFLEDKRYPLYTQIKIKLDNLLEYLKIKKYIKKYNVDDSVFKDYNLDNYHENIPEIMKLLLIKTTNSTGSTSLDDIKDIKTFLNSTKSNELKDSLKLDNNKYIYQLFKIFIEYKNIELANEIISLLIEKEEEENVKYFNKCINYIYNNYCKKDNEKFKNYCKNSKFEEYLLENNNKYLDILIDNNDFMKDEKITFPPEKKPNDILLLFSLIKNNKINKGKNKSCNDLFISFDYFNNNYENKNLQNLIDSYYKNKKDDENNRINYNYSLHPKLIELLKAKNYFHLFENLKITLKTKIKIYKFCLLNKICTLNDIINNYEAIKLKRKAETDQEILEKYKLLFNLYKEKEENNGIFKELNNLIKKNYDKEQIKKIAFLLINFNLSNKLFISYDNLLFLHFFFDYKINSSDEKELKLLKLLSSLNNKINILPFCSDFNEIFLNNKQFHDILEKYNKNNMNISLKENNLYFEEIKSKNISNKPNIYFQSLELFNVLNIGNVFNIKNIMEHLNEKIQDKINIDFLFIFKMTMNYLTINCPINNRINYGLNNLLGIFNSSNLGKEEINILLKEIFFFQSISYINNSNHNILQFNENFQLLIKNFMKAKKSLIDMIIKMYYNGEISNNLVFSSYKIFLVKSEIIKEMKDDEISNMYNSIKNINDFKDINEIIKDYKKLQEKIFEIYSK